MYALYAFARVTDDLGDAPHLSGHRDSHQLLAVCRNLEAWRDATARALLQGSEICSESLRQLELPAEIRGLANRLLPALAHASTTFHIPSQYLLDLVDGVLSDQTQTRFLSFEQLEHYCYQVASSVGLACMYIWGFHGTLPYSAAVDCGVAFQLTNILRDVREDARRNRIYVPKEFWNAGGLGEADFLAAKPTPAVLGALASLSQRAVLRYQRGWEIFDSVHQDGQKMFSMMWRTYRCLHERLDQDPYRGLRSRMTLPLSTKARLLLSHLIDPWYRRLPIPPLECQGVSDEVA